MSHNVIDNNKLQKLLEYLRSEERLKLYEMIDFTNYKKNLLNEISIDSLKEIILKTTAADVQKRHITALIKILNEKKIEVDNIKYEVTNNAGANFANNQDQQSHHVLNADLYSQRRIRILFVEAAPTNMPSLKITKELDSIIKKLPESKFESNFAMDFREENWFNILDKFKPDILHFSGHGERNLYLFDAEGKKMSKDFIVGILSSRAARNCGNLKIVVFNACYSYLFAKDLSETMDITIGMIKEIEDEAAIIFSTQLYSSIAMGNSFQRSYKDALAILEQKYPDSKGVPTVCYHSDVDVKSDDYVLCRELNDE